MKEISRRSFLELSAGGALAARVRGFAGGPVVDTHMHVWTDETSRFPFSHPYNPDFRPPPLAGTVEKLVEEMGVFAVSHAVLVQVIYYGWDNAYLVDCLQRFPGRFRGQGLIDPLDPDRAARLEFWMRRGLSGMRFSPIYYEGKDDWLNSEESFPLWRKAEELSAIFNFFIATPQLPRLEEMIGRFPGVRVVIDHLARVDLEGPDPEGEFEKLTRLARYPNVSAKVSELEIISASKEYPFRDTFPYVRKLYDAFGPDRLLWGTGFPAATRTQAGRLPLEKELALIREEIPLFNDRERVQIMGGNAFRLWDFRPEASAAAPNFSSG